MNSDFKPDAVVIGAGYVGLTLSLHLASKGLNILAVDNNEKVVKDLQKGKSSIYEKSIQSTLKKCVQSEKIQFSTEAIAKGCNYWILAISYFPGDKSHYLRALDNIKGFENEAPTIMIRGTVPIGYLSQTILPALEKRFATKLDEGFYLASAPERSLSGAALEELEDLPQIIGASDMSFMRASSLFNKSGIHCIHLSNLEGGEIAKTFTNFARLVQFNLSNYLGALCHKFDISEEIMFNSVKEGYPRLNFLSSPGPGVGGFCLPKDSLVLYDGIMELFTKDSKTQAFVDFPKQQFELNQSIMQDHAKIVCKLLQGRSKILAMGMAFKGIPQTDDIRDSVGVFIVKYLLQKDIQVEVFDRTVPLNKLNTLALKVSEYPERLDEYDAVLLLNNDPKYRHFLQQNIKTKDNSTIALYDPWRLIVTGKETIFQSNFPKQNFNR